MNFGVIGVGKVGLCLASYFRGLGHEVSVWDRSKALLDKIRNGENPLPHESGIRLDLNVCALLETLAVRRDVIFVVTPTPQVGNVLSAGPVIDVLGRLEQLYATGISGDPPAVAVVSTLDPRDAKSVCSGYSFPVVYNPPLIRLGSVVDDLKNATIAFLGYDKQVRFVEPQVEHPDHPVQTVLRAYGERKAKPVIGDVTSIAAAKLAINATLSARAAWGNDLARRAIAVGAKMETVYAALDAEPRIGGSSYMRAGPPPGGPCLPRDMTTWASLGEGIDSDPDQNLALVTTRSHARELGAQIDRILEQIPAHATTVAILGLAYKPRGFDLTDALGFELAKVLDAETDLHVVGCDPTVGKMVEAVVPIEIIDDPVAAVRIADFVVVCLNTEENRAAIEARKKTDPDFPVYFADFRR